ncbi:uncharacterized protein LY89DRAFT_691535 [Mollisia scopiformis]|uniref:Uncharacterized protein n=1 Tax=Mollisia scopiformis TaxID=149040 RepID=A0A132B772_MOLSC|nr:uncharacterized protein LY89DRAFT_691535 [Mollisia scopiformis]KUJ07849.1 hypothetical protein LY89DRAFT_691535 [Mollisia scopiformis]
MATEIFPARYTEERIILKELRKIFPQGDIRIMFERARFFCTVPARLTAAQREIVKDAISAEQHYSRDDD